MSSPDHNGDVQPPERGGICCRRCDRSHPLQRRMILCTTCGNKRCPRATNHELACTGSNDTGQPGSDYR